jgi:opacity protein-like surface antigen
MKIKSAVIMVFLFISASFSQNIFVSVGSGLSVPMAESGFTDAYNLGFNAHGSLTFPLSNNVSVRGDIQYNNFPYDESSPNFGGNFTATTIKGDLIVGKFDSREVSPYGLAGAGLYIISASITQNNVSISSSETDFGIGIGGGVNFGVSPKASIYIETQYNFIFNDGTAKGYLPIKAGVMFRL